LTEVEHSKVSMHGSSFRTAVVQRGTITITTHPGSSCSGWELEERVTMAPNGDGQYVPSSRVLVKPLTPTSRHIDRNSSPSCPPSSVVH